MNPSPQTQPADLDALHASYVVAINSAIDSGNDHYVPGLVAAYDRELGAPAATGTKPGLLSSLFGRRSR